MPSRSALVGNPIATTNALLGYVTSVSLITAASGTAQNGYKAPSDVIVVTAANGSNTAITLPDPFLQNWNPGDFYECVNGTSQACVIFPPTGGNINGAGANASVALAANKAVRVYITTVVSAASTFNTLTGA
jgi:hypothetical protein